MCHTTTIIADDWSYPKTIHTPMPKKYIYTAKKFSPIEALHQNTLYNKAITFPTFPLFRLDVSNSTEWNDTIGLYSIPNKDSEPWMFRYICKRLRTSRPGNFQQTGINHT